jgi:hypothetical protein
VFKICSIKQSRVGSVDAARERKGDQPGTEKRTHRGHSFWREGYRRPSPKTF